jgi:hypothetical protein
MDEMTGADGAALEGVTTNTDMPPAPDTQDDGGADSFAAELGETPGEQAGSDNGGFVLPENMQKDDALLSEFGALGAELGVSNQQLQKIIDFGIKKGVLGGVDAEELLNKKVNEQVKAWETELKRDSEVGGARLNESLTLARRGIDKLGGAELLSALDETGAGVHPAVFKAFVKAGRMFGEDKFVMGERAQSAPMTPEAMARVLYPNMRHS